MPNEHGQLTAVKTAQDGDGPRGRLLPEIQSALLQLAEAWEYARQSTGNVWDYAVEIERLRVLGLSNNELRWLLRQHFVEHAHEITTAADGDRRFERSLNLALTERTCFVLTSRGVEFLTAQCGDAAVVRRLKSPSMAHAPVAARSLVVPEWDPDLRILSVGGRVVKKFVRPSPNQEAVLTAFQKEGWPTWIADPLSNRSTSDGKNRLHETIKSLNKSQSNAVIRFRGDGTGEGLMWGFSPGVG